MSVYLQDPDVCMQSKLLNTKLHPQLIRLVFFCCCFLDTGLCYVALSVLCSLECPGTQYVGQADLKRVTILPASVSQVLELELGS